MKISDWIIDSTKKLGAGSIESPRQDAIILLEDVLKKDRTWILAHDENKLSKIQLTELSELIKKRRSHEPLAYIRQLAWFYGRQFYVDSRVLIPRPETESLVELALNSTKIKSPKVLDLGCGSGIIGITIKLEMPQWRVDLADISLEAIEVAKINSEKHKVNLAFYESNLLDKLSEDYDLILTNLPYVPEKLVTSEEITKEPNLALFSGEDGLDLYRLFWKSLSELKKPKIVVAESLESQHMIMAGLAKEAGFELVKTSILAQSFKRI